MNTLIFSRVPQFSFDSLLFKQKFLELQRRLHPDKFSLKSEVKHYNMHYTYMTQNRLHSYVQT